MLKEILHRHGYFQSWSVFYLSFLRTLTLGFLKGDFLLFVWGWPAMLWAFSHRIILPVRKRKKKKKNYFKSMLSLLIGMVETSLICLLHSTTKSFKMPCPDMLTVLPPTCDKLPHLGCSQHEPQPLLQPRILVDRRSQWQFLNRSVYIDKIHAENVFRRTCQRRKASLIAPVTD